jgi:O-methyltransferase domain
MVGLTSNPGHSPQYLATGYPWASLEAGSTVVDVGGSKGHVSIAIAKEHSHLSFIVQDRPKTISEAALGDEIEEGVKKRISFMAHDILQKQTVGGDIFLLRWVLHDWPDVYVVRILQNLRPVLKEGNKVVVNDHLMPGLGEVSTGIERRIRSVVFFPDFCLAFVGCGACLPLFWLTLCSGTWI